MRYVLIFLVIILSGFSLTNQEKISAFINAIYSIHQNNKDKNSYQEHILSHVAPQNLMCFFLVFIKCFIEKSEIIFDYTNYFDI